MSRLFLHCSLCGRRQADGLLSRGHWGHVRAADGTTVSVCPECKGRHVDWPERVDVTQMDGRVQAPGRESAAVPAP